MLGRMFLEVRYRSRIMHSRLFVNEFWMIYPLCLTSKRLFKKILRGFVDRHLRACSELDQMYTLLNPYLSRNHSLGWSLETFFYVLSSSIVVFSLSGMLVCLNIAFTLSYLKRSITHFGILYQCLL